MKVVRLDSRKTCELWAFMRDRLPSSLRATEFGDGYGSVYGIEVKERSDWRAWLPLSTGIATVTHNEIELRHPEWFSDLQDLVQQYEAQTGVEVTFKLWES